MDIAGTWVSGITEVAVPVKYKMENVEAAEAAKKALLGDRDDGKPEEPVVKLRRGQLPKGFGARFAVTPYESTFVGQAMRAERRAGGKKRNRDA